MKNKRKINPLNKPGPECKEGTPRNKTLITKVTEIFFRNLDEYCDERDYVKSDFVRIAIEEKMKRDS